MFDTPTLTLLFKALVFAAEKHRLQRRKDQEASPYINHPLQVAQILWETGQVRDPVTLIGGLLHDTLEDTNTTSQEIETLFGHEVLTLVQEVSDDKRLPKTERKRLQIEHAPYSSLRAKQIKLADKICNVYDLIYFPPSDWSWQRRWEYLEWSAQVVAGLRGVNQALEAHYDDLWTQSRTQLLERT